MCTPNLRKLHCCSRTNILIDFNLFLFFSSKHSGISTPVKASTPPPTSFQNILSKSNAKEPKIVSKTPSKRYPPPSLSGATPFAPIAEEDSLITPPSERYANKNCAAEADPNTANTPPKKRSCSDHMDELCTPLKALREAVRLATPSPVKLHFPQRKNLPTTPGTKPRDHEPIHEGSEYQTYD